MLTSLLALDDHVFQWLHRWNQFAPSFWKVCSVYGVYVIPLVLLWFWFARRREIALYAFLAGAIAWQGLNSLISHFIYRQRPEDVYGFAISQTEGVFHRPGSSFPSDHTAFMTAIGLIFLMAGEKKVAWFIFIVEFVTVLGRVVVGFHWPGDILGGVLVGFVTVGLFSLFKRPINKWVVEPIVKVARKLGL